MTEKPLWDARKSTTLSMVVAWVALALGTVGLFMLIPVLKMIRDAGYFLDNSFVIRAIGPAYACLICGIVADIVLLRLLADIRRGEVFTLANVRRLRAISYCGFAIALACAIGATITMPRPAFIALGLVAGFLGLLMRVIKNVIDAARLLKEDADYTI